MQGRLVPTEKKGKIQFFPAKNWKKEVSIASKNNLRLMEWTINLENIKKNPIFSSNESTKAKSFLEKKNIKINSVTCDFFMQRPFFKLKNYTKEIDLLKKIIINAQKISIKYLIIPLVDNSSIKNSSQEKILIKNMKEISKLLKKNNKILFEIDYKPKKILTFIKKFPSKFGINYDTGNSASLNYKFEEEKIYFKYVFNIHIKDRLRNGPTVKLGNGDYNFYLFFKYLKKIRYKNNLILQTARSKKNKDLQEILENKLYIERYL